MPPEDLAVYHSAITNGVAGFEPWVRKLRPQDRLVIRDEQGTPPFGALEWQSIGYGLWSGRLRAPGPGGPR